MAIDPKQLEAFANPDGEGGEGDMPPEEEAPPQEGGDSNFDALIPLLEANAEELESNAEELDGDLLLNVEQPLEEEDQAALIEGLEALPDDLKEGLRAAQGLDLEKAEQLAQHLEAEEMIGDADRFAAYLVRAQQALGGMTEEAEEGEEEAEEDEEEYEEEPLPEEA